MIHVNVVCFRWLLLLLLVVLQLQFTTTFAVYTEEERLHQYAARNYTWPIPTEKFVPSTPGWERLIRRRIQQIEAMPTTAIQEKYDAWLLAMFSGIVAPNFTQYGWAVVKVLPDEPSMLLQEFQSALRKGWDMAVSEPYDPAIIGDPVIVPLSDDLKQQALLRLQPYFEAWIGGTISLFPENAYGLRIYPNQSSLYMHVDQYATHVISGIFHIDHSDDSQPWPLVIEDLEGTTQQIILDKGDMLLYESSKCLHGRPIPFQGSWYTSLFLHYRPLDIGWENLLEEPHFAVPPHWQEEQRMTPEQQNQLANGSLESLSSQPPRLQVIETAILEPDCPNLWCLLSNDTPSITRIWNGPSKSGIAMSSHGTEQVLHKLETLHSGEEEL